MSEKNLDHKGRWRDVTVAFRMSKPESDDLNTRVRLSGLSKQDYIIKRLSEKEIVVVGNPRVHKALRNQMENIYSELKRISQINEADSDFLTTIQLVSTTLNGLKEEENV